jgi:hypothetical protein
VSTPRSGVGGDYFTWLYGNIALLEGRNPIRSHWMLAEQLHKTDFAYRVANDSNRAEDGVRLRDRFVELYPDEPLPTGPCSMLEMLVALAVHMELMAGEGDHPRGVDEWFWHMLDNAGLSPFTDEAYITDDLAHFEAEQVISLLNSRRYETDGRGGLFPLHHPREDQTRVELWNQMSAYLLENIDFWL